MRNPIMFLVFFIDTDRQTDRRQTDRRQADRRQTDRRQTDRQTDRQEADKSTPCTCVHGNYIKTYLREDIHAHKEENIEEKENQNGPCYVNSNVKTGDKYYPAENSQQA